MMREIFANKYFQETLFGLGKKNKLLRINFRKNNFYDNSIDLEKKK